MLFLICCSCSFPCLLLDRHHINTQQTFMKIYHFTPHRTHAHTRTPHNSPVTCLFIPIPLHQFNGVGWTTLREHAMLAQATLSGTGTYGGRLLTITLLQDVATLQQTDGGIYSSSSCGMRWPAAATRQNTQGGATGVRHLWFCRKLPNLGRQRDQHHWVDSWLHHFP